MNTKLVRLLVRLHMHDGDYLGITGFGFALFFTLASLALVAVIGSIAVAINTRNCHYASTQLGRPTRYDILAGCYIRTDSGAYVPLGSYRAVTK
jgi:hypothetical protein